MNRFKTVLSCCLLGLLQGHAVLAQDLKLWDNKPAKDWMSQAYPIGNGRMGAMIFGGVKTEHIQFNEQSLWTGDEEDTGAYQALGDVFINFDGASSQDSIGYRRELQLQEGLHQVSYSTKNSSFQREYFASFPHKALVFHYTAKQKKGYSGTIQLKDARFNQSTGIDNSLFFIGKLENGLAYATSLQVKHVGGKITLQHNAAGEAELRFKDVDSFSIYLMAATDFTPDRSKNWREGKPLDKIETIWNPITVSNYQKIKASHQQDYKSLYNRVNLQLGPANQAAENQKTTAQRIIQYKQKADPNLEALLFQYGRYLLISSSRPGGLPANLQGVWNNSNTPPWRSDYHSNINVQMNYWPAESANLSETAIPYLDFINNIREVKKEHSQKEFPGVRGWTVKTENNIFGGESFSWNIPGSAWFAQALWEHYAFTQNKTYLKDFAYPILKEIVEFWDDHLKRRPDGTLVAPNGWSPEHGPTEDGVSHDQQIIYDLFTNYIESADALGIDKSYRDHVADLKAHLLAPKIGKWGQLQEWETDRDDPNDKHRHVSHLFALHPGRQISLEKTPELAKAARVSLEARGDESTGWSMAWKMNFWARLQDGNRAYKILNNFISLAKNDGNIDYDHGGGIYENMLCSHPPFQIDGNLGYVAGVVEMLLQSHEDYIEFLPALPDAWKKSGQVKGIKARGNIIVDLTWKDGLVTNYRLYSPIKKSIKVKVNGQLKTETVQEK